MKIHGDKKRRELYRKRHSVREDWNNPLTSGFWSSHILWGKYTDPYKNLEWVLEKFFS